MRRGRLENWYRWAALGILAGGGAALLFLEKDILFGLRAGFDLQEKQESSISLAPKPAPAVFFKPIDGIAPVISSQGKAVHADLDFMQVRLYENGVLVNEFPVIAKGKPGSQWEAPSGEYRVIAKEERHYSSQARAWMSYSVAFSTNFFVHGVPENLSGKEMPREFAAGSIRVSRGNARVIYEFADEKTPFFVTDEGVVGTGEWEYVATNKTPPKVSAKAFLVGDVDTGAWFLEKNRGNERPIASVTKLMSAIVASDSIPGDTRLTVDTDDLDIYGDQGHLKDGEVLTREDLLSPLLLSSSNDAAYTLSGALGVEEFVKKMNEKARDIGLRHTHYSDPSGLHTENISTPEDLLSLIRYMRDSYPQLLNLTRMAQKTVKTNKITHTWYGYNWKSGDKEFLGGKIGYIGTAGKTMVALFRIPISEFTTRDVGVAVLGSTDDEYDVKKLINWAKESIVYTQKIEGRAAAFAPLEVRNGEFRPDEEYTLLFAGDIMTDRGIREMVGKYGGGDYFFPFTGIAKEIQDADVAFGNLEGPVSDQGEKQGSIYSFRMDPASIKTLYDVGFDAVSVANNHMGDYGRDAFEDTLRRLRYAEIASVGAGWNKLEALRVRVIERVGKRIGFLAFSDIGPQWLAAGDTTSGIAIASKDAVQNAVRQSRDKADILVVSFHFGEEYETHSRARQQDLAHAAIDAGADIVVGHHPHVVQEIEQYKGGVIAYSLGNLIFDQAFSPETKEGLLMNVHVKGKQIEQIERMPLSFNEYFQPIIKK